MPPDAYKQRAKCATPSLERDFLPQKATPTDSTSKQDDETTTAIANSNSVECVFQRVLTDFSYREQPIRCVLTCHANDKYLSCNGRPVFFTQRDKLGGNNNEFALISLPDGTLLIKNTRTNRFLASNSDGSVFTIAGHERTSQNLVERWTMTQPQYIDNGYFITSVMTNRKLAGLGSMVRTEEDDMEGTSAEPKTMTWSVDLTSGELCFLSLTKAHLKVRCDLAGELSLSKNSKGWEAWRLVEVGDGYVRISPWAHSKKCLSSNDSGEVCTQEKMGESEKWSVVKAPTGLDGVVIKSAKNGRVLRYDDVAGKFCTSLRDNTGVDSSCVWGFESLHQQTYYLVTTAGSYNDRRLEAAKRGLGSRNLPNRVTSEEWKIEPTAECGKVTLFSNARQSYLGSLASGEVFLTNSPRGDGSEKWVIEEREEGNVLISHVHERVLVCPEKGSICTVAPGTIVTGSTRWRLQPKIPRQVTREKMQAVGAAALVGIATSVATPLVLGAVVGLIGITQVGIAGQVAIVSVRAAEAISTFTRVTLSSSQLVVTESNVLSSDATNNDNAIGNRPFCAWRTW